MHTILDAIGNTPILSIKGVKVKLEYMNPSGSIKDRIAKYIISKAEKEGKLKKGWEVVEATSGNSGIAFAMVCAVKGYKMNVIMPKGLTRERKKIMKYFGAKLIQVPKRKGVEGAMKVEERYRNKKGYYCVKQFENPWNINAHMITGKEILKQVGKVDAVVAGVGTGGTLIGVGKVLKKANPKCKLYALEPEECSAMTGGSCGKHGIEGIGDGFVPGIIEKNDSLIDGVLTVKSKDAVRASKNLAKKGFFVGISSGANLLGALKVKRMHKKVVTFFPDSGDRYLSELFK